MDETQPTQPEKTIEELKKELLNEFKNLKDIVVEGFIKPIKQTKEEFEEQLRELSDELINKKDNSLKTIDSHIKRLQEVRELVENDDVILVRCCVHIKTVGT